MFHCLEELGLRRKRDSKSVPRDDESGRSARQLCGLERGSKPEHVSGRKT